MCMPPSIARRARAASRSCHRSFRVQRVTQHTASGSRRRRWWREDDPRRAGERIDGPEGCDVSFRCSPGDQPALGWRRIAVHAAAIRDGNLQTPVGNMRSPSIRECDRGRSGQVANVEGNGGGGRGGGQQGWLLRVQPTLRSCERRIFRPDHGAEFVPDAGHIQSHHHPSIGHIFDRAQVPRLR